MLNGERFFSLAEAQALIEAWRLHFNAVRPHSALSYRPLAPETIVPHRDAVVLWASALALGSARSPSVKWRHELTGSPLGGRPARQTKSGDRRRVGAIDVDLDALRNEGGVEADHLKHFLRIEQAGPSDPSWLSELSVKSALSPFGPNQP